MDFSTYTVNNWPENDEILLKHLENPTISNQIPLLNVNDADKFEDGALVRFQGMIQDMYGPEYYYEKFEVFNEKLNQRSIKTGKYRDVCMSNEDEQIDTNSNINITSERQAYVVVTIPATNEWVTTYQEEKYLLNTVLKPCTSSNNKRSFDEAMEDDTEPKNLACDTKKPCQNNEQSTSNSTSQPLVSKDYILNFPIPDSKSKVCQVKIYKDSDTLKINDVCEFVGFLSLNPVTPADQEEDLESKMETETHFPPTSLVPRIHVISFKKLEHNNPLLSEVTLESDFSNLKKEALIVLTQLLLGDTLAAEYLLYHLISEVYLRRDFMAIGKFSLNLSNVPAFENIDYALELYKFIEMLMPKSHYLPMTLENMNTLTFTPKKDYVCNRLTSGILQLSANTHLVLDETKLTAGKLDTAGLNNVKALSYAIKAQKIPYDFNYYSIEYESNIPFLIISEGRSMLNSDTHVMLQPEDSCVQTFQEIIEAAKHFLKPQLLNQIRVYLTQARCVKYEINESVQDLVQAEFVAMRQRGAVTADDLHSLLVLARLVSISEGKNTLDDVCWKKACSLEEQRKQRMEK